MKLTIYQVDAFAEKVFEGNPAAVVPLQNWLTDDVMQNIAKENNLSETAFFIPTDSGFHIRWFTPGAEVDLCGHATLATAHILFKHLNYDKDIIEFESRSGKLLVKESEELLFLNFPTSDINAIAVPDNLKLAFNIEPTSCYKGRDDIMLCFQSERDIVNLQPDFLKIIESETRGVICTAQSDKYDFVSRFFAPAVGVNEDPVTGSAHTMLIPYWAKQLDKSEMLAKQISKRGGVLHCKFLNNRVEIGGKALTYLTGEITL